MDSTPSEMVIELRSKQQRKAHLPIDFTLPGIITELSFPHSAKAISPMEATPSEMVKELRLPQPLKAYKPMDSTLPGMIRGQLTASIESIIADGFHATWNDHRGQFTAIIESSFTDG